MSKYVGLASENGFWLMIISQIAGEKSVITSMI